jgi:hypothetical protein
MVVQASFVGLLFPKVFGIVIQSGTKREWIMDAFPLNTDLIQRSVKCTNLSPLHITVFPVQEATSVYNLTGILPHHTDNLPTGL